MAPAVGFEPTTNRLTADRSTTELRWIFFSRLRSVYLACAICDGKWFLAVKKNAAGKQRPVQQNRLLLKFWLRGRDLNPRSGSGRIMSCVDANQCSHKNPCRVLAVSVDSPIFSHQSAATPHFARQSPKDRVLSSNVIGRYYVV